MALEFSHSILSFRDFTRDHIQFLVRRGQELEKYLRNRSQVPQRFFQQRGVVAALVFLEPSTRTRVAFERACQISGRSFVSLESKGSSLEKGESLEDTLLNLRSLGVEMAIVRTSEKGGLEPFRGLPGLSVVNAGDGTGEHPTQALGDLYTLLKIFDPKKLQLKSLAGLKVGICGDVAHSRVARSWYEMAQLLDLKLSVWTPDTLWPSDWEQAPERFSSKYEFLKGNDVILALRVQKERLSEVSEDQALEWGGLVRLTDQDLRPEQILLHPGPVNWGVELTREVRNLPNNKILEQVRSGLCMRAVLLEALARSRKRGLPLKKKA